MSEQPLRFYSSAQVRELDRRAIADYSIPAYTLMQRAAAVAWRVLHERWPKARTIHVLAGSGNNGGDGYEVARLAKAAGNEVRIWQVGPAPAEGPAAQAMKAWQQEGGVTGAFPGSLDAAQVIVDAMLGIGLARALEGEYADAVQAINRRHEQGAGVLAIDVPTGLDADSGKIWGASVQADATTTFIGRKIGLFTGVGPEYAGEVVFDALGIPDAVYERVDGIADGLQQAELKRWLPRRPRVAHKGSFGHVLIIGGDEGMSGAVLMAARAALRVGAGLVTIATHPSHAAMFVSAQPEVMAWGLHKAHELAPLLRKATVIAIGPGLGMRDWGRGLWAQALTSDKPMVVDADGLNWLSQEQTHRDDWVLTPHPGEAARLLGIGKPEIQADRPGAAALLRERFGGVSVLKGAGTLVRGARLGLCTHGNPGMATGGMGDVLTGVIVGLLAQKLPLEDAARCGVLMHALAGDRAAMVAERGMLPSDLIGALRHFANP